MPKQTLIKVERVSKKFCRSLKRSMLYGAQDLAREVFRLHPRTEELRKSEFWAIDDVSFEVNRGDCLGVIGANGAGKSTLLKMLGGVVLPDKGRITVRGRVGALIELGAGFHPALTGRENIYINGAILGLSKKDLDRKFDEIVAFAELEEFIDTPVKFYSSGMNVRLGFAIAAHVKPDILLIDEVLAVGDNRFRARCTRRIAHAIATGTAAIFVSHNMNEIIRLCDRAIWIDKGHIVQSGDISNTVGAYLFENDREETRQAEREDVKIFRGARLRSLQICDAAGNVQSRFRTGESLVVHFDYEKDPEIEALTFSFAMSLGDEKSYVSCHSPWTGFVVRSRNTAGRVTLTIPQLLLNTGLYLVNVGIWDQSFKCAYDWRWAFQHIEIRNENDRFTGRFFLPHQWTESREKSSPAVFQKDPPQNMQ